MTVEEFIITLRECVDCDKNTIALQNRLKEDLLMSSLSMMMFLIKAEEKTGLSIDDRLLAKAETVQDLFDIVNGAVKK